MRIYIKTITLLLLLTNIAFGNMQPIPCQSSASMFSGQPTEMKLLDLETGVMSSITNNLSTDELNAVGYNKKDGFIWGVDQISRDGTLIKVGLDNNGNYISEKIKIVDETFDSYIGDIDDNGHLFIKTGQSDTNEVIVIDLDPNSDNYLKRIDRFSLSNNIVIHDWAFNPIDDFLYAVEKETNTLYKIDPNDGTVSSLGNTGMNETQNLGASFFDKNANFYVYANKSGKIYKISVATSSVATYFSSTDIVARNDGAMCSDIDLSASNDFGDAPDNYTHVSHKIDANLYLGDAVPDAEADQQSSTDATGDGADDSDGVVGTLPTLTVGDSSYTVAVKVLNNTGKDAFITAWIDFNRNGTFEFSEALNTNNLSIPSSSTPQTVNIVWDDSTDGETQAIATATEGKAIMRIRLTTKRILRCIEDYDKDTEENLIAPDGEVEDYEITILKPFTCNDTLFISNKTNLETGIDNGKMWMHQINRDQIPYNFSSIGDGYTGISSAGYNAIGYNVEDNFIYGIDYNSLIKIDANGTEFNLGAIEGFPPTTVYAGEFDRDGFYYVAGWNSDKLYKIDINQRKIVQTLTLHYSDSTTNQVMFSDIAIDKSGEYFYAMLSVGRVDKSDPDNGDLQNDKVVKIRISDGEMTPIGGDQSHLASSVSLVYSDIDGDVFMMNNESGYFKLNTETGELYEISSTSHLAYYNDGTSCPDANISEPVSVSMSDLNVTEGDDGNKTVTLTLHFSHQTEENTGFSIRFIEGTAKNAANHEGEERDYLATDHNITLPVGVLNYTVSVEIIGDTFVEGDEEFYVELYQPNNVLLFDTRAVITIENDDTLTLNVERVNSHTSDDNQTQLRREALYTQISGRDFDFDIVAYDKYDKDHNLTDMTIKVELLDLNTSEEDNVLYQRYYYIGETFETRFSITDNNDLEIPRATREAGYKLSIIYDVNGSLLHGKFDEDKFEALKSLNGNKEASNDSRDTFAIRPAAFKLLLKAKDENGTNNSIATNVNINNGEEYSLSAGYPYELNVTAMDFTNSTPTAKYDEQDVNATLIFEDDSACDITDDIKLNPLNFEEGVVVEDAFKHTNVGKYKLSVIANSWSTIDMDEEGKDCIKDSSIISQNGDEKSGCNIEASVTVQETKYSDLNLTFEPYKFDISNFTVEHINAGSHYLYMNNGSTDMGIRIKGDVIAKAYDDTKTTNFTKECHASDVVITFENNITNDGTTIEPIIINNKAHQDLNKTILEADDFNKTDKGSSNIEILYNILKDENNPMNPVKLNLGDMNASSTDAKSEIATGEHTPRGSKDLDASNIFYYTQVVSQRKNYAETSQQTIITPIFVDIYCKNNTAWCTDEMNLGAVGQYSERTEKGWYLAIKHNALEDGRVTGIASNNALIITTFAVDSNLAEGKIPNLETIHNGEVADLQEAQMIINTDPWLNSDNNFYNVSYKNQSTLSGTGKTGYLLNSTKNVEKNGKMSW